MMDINEQWPQRIAVSKWGMVATQHSGATEAGKEILADGGNAIDAAVASAFALGVCEPQASGLGGQTMILAYIPSIRKTLAIDGSSHAPSRAMVEEFKHKESRLAGYSATTVPSTPAVLSYMLEHYGNMPLHRVLEPAIHLAEEGYAITGLQNRLQEREIEKWNQGNASALFLKNDSIPYSVGDNFKQPVLAHTLKEIGKQGIDLFYRGEIAARIEEDMLKNDGYIRRDDLANIPYPIERRPVSGKFESLRVVTFPPPGAGRTLIEMLNILSQFTPKQRDLNSLEGLALLVEIIRRAQLDRIDRPFDPNFYPQVQDRRMLSMEYAKLAARQMTKRVRKTGGETTHLSVMDEAGNIVSLTQSIERVYGSFNATSDLGFLYNNYMSAFDYSDITHPHYLRANGVPWASVAPTIVFKGKKPVIAVGSPGSERIASSIAQVILRLLDGMPPLEAITAPRLHCSVGGCVHLEASRFRNDLIPFLKKRGLTIKEKEPFAFYMGCIQMVLKAGKRGFVGVADPRRDGSAAGPDRKPVVAQPSPEPELDKVV